jgi:hypothetical protein
MPDFFDRLVARGIRPDGGGSGSAAAPTSGPERLAGMVVARPRIPGLFERPAPPAPERELEAEAEVVAHAPGAVRPPAAPLAAAPQHLTHAQLVQAPVAYRGAEPDRAERPPHPAPAAAQLPFALLPAAPQLAPPAAVAPAVRPAAQSPASAIRPRPDREIGAADEPAPLLPGTPVRTAQPQIPVATARRLPATAAAAVAATGRPPHALPPPARPTVRISIGRIEVRPSDPPRGHGPAKPAAVRPAPVLSLDRFLAGGAGQQ